MKLSTLAIAALAPLAFAADCQNKDYDHDPLNISTASAKRALNSLRTRDLLQVDMYWHILVSKTPEGEDWGPSIQSQVNFLNAHYEPWGYHLNLKFTTYVIGAEWAGDIDVDKENKMRTLHQGDYQTLNIYLVEGAGGGMYSALSILNTTLLTCTHRCMLPPRRLRPTHLPRPPRLRWLLRPPRSRPQHDQRHAGTRDRPLVRPPAYLPGRLRRRRRLLRRHGTAKGAKPRRAGHARGSGQLPCCGPVWEGACECEELCEFHTCYFMGDAVANGVKMDYTDCSQEFTPCQGGRMHVAWSRYRAGRALAEGLQVKW